MLLLKEFYCCYRLNALIFTLNRWSESSWRIGTTIWILKWSKSRRFASSFCLSVVWLLARCTRRCGSRCFLNQIFPFSCDSPTAWKWDNNGFCSDKTFKLNSIQDSYFLWDRHSSTYKKLFSFCRNVLFNTFSTPSIWMELAIRKERETFTSGPAKCTSAGSPEFFSHLALLKRRRVS